jgi:ATP-dependent DNA helicase DinG
LGAEVVALREWIEAEAKDGGTGEKDNAPRHTDQVWRQVSVSARECVGAGKCAYGVECFAERAKDKAAKSQLVVTNHSLLAIDAIEGIPMIPEYDVVVIDEAHELTGDPSRHRRAFPGRRRANLATGPTAHRRAPSR